MGTRMLEWGEWENEQGDDVEMRGKGGEGCWDEEESKNAEAECLSAEVATPLTRCCPETCRLPQLYPYLQIQIQLKMNLQTQIRHKI